MTKSATATQGMSMEELMAQLDRYMPVTPKRGALIQGTVFRIDPKVGAWIDFGGKSDALVPTDEIEGLSEGQSATFFVLSTPEDGEFESSRNAWNGPVFSARRARAWTEVRDSADKGAKLTVKVGDVKRYSRGDQSGSIAGVNVYFNGLKGFVPYSLLGVGGKAVEGLVGTDLEVRVAEFSVEDRKLVFDRRSIVAEKAAEVEAARETLFASLKPGDVRTGKVVRIVEYGCFVDIGEGLHGLVHRSELSNDSKAPVTQLIKVGDVVGVKVLRAETVDSKRQLALSVKQVRQAAYLNDVKVGDLLTGTISRLTAFGAFVELSAEHGVDGLIHKSQFSSAVRSGRKNLIAGESIRVKVIEVDLEKGRVSLSLKEVSQPRATEAEADSTPSA